MANVSYQVVSRSENEYVAFHDLVSSKVAQKFMQREEKEEKMSIQCIMLNGAKLCPGATARPSSLGPTY
eukprot:7087085-Ditylum_brightwellii.AAC.1